MNVEQSSAPARLRDRARRRDPGDATLGLSQHIDGGSIERWIDPALRAVYCHAFFAQMGAA